MKRFLATFAVLVVLTAGLFCEESVAEAAAAEESVSVTAVDVPLKVGGYFTYEPVLGKLSPYVYCNLGGGVSVEYDLPIPVAEGMKAGFLLDHLGISARVGAGGYPIRPEDARKGVSNNALLGMWNMRIQLGVFTAIPFGNSGFSFVPDISGGILLNMPKDDPQYGNELPKCYCDQLYTVSLGFRYANEKLLNGKLEFELAPEYSVAPETVGAVHLLGFRIGVLYNFKQ